MKILGIDPGYDIVGWSLINSKLNLQDYGVIKTSSNTSLDERLYKIHLNLQEIILKYNPDCAALEKIFFQNNAKTAIAVSKACGVIILTLKIHGLSFIEYSPTQVKHSITGYGKASKEQLGFVIKKVLNIDTIKGPDDASDAIAIALCHALNFSKL